MASSSKEQELAIKIAGKVENSFKQSLGVTEDGLNKIASVAKKAAAVAAAAFAAVKVGDFISGAVDEYAEFEQAMANTSAIAGASADDYAKLSAAAREAGKATTFTASEAADALGYMALAGWNVEESTAALTPVLKLAEATQADLATTSDQVTDSMSAMGVGIDDLQGYLDVIVTTNNVLEGVWIPMFYGSILGADTSTPKMVSLAGLQPCYNNTTDKEHTAIANFSSRAAFLGGGIVQTITDLLIMFAKSTNSQEAYGYGNSSGYDASLAPTNGVKQNAVVGGGQFYGTKDAKSLNKIFHSIVLGTYQQWMRDPYTLLVNGRYKVSKNYTYDVTGAKYQDTGISLPKMFDSDGSTQKYGIFYPHKYQTVPGFGAVPVHPCKGSTSTGGCEGRI